MTPHDSRPSAPSPAPGRASAPPVSHGDGPQCRPSKAGDTGGADHSVCSYAGCSLLGMYEDPAFPDWAFCRQHYLEHRADVHGEAWPHMGPVDLRWLMQEPCGTPAAYRRHQRHGEKPCVPCTEANLRSVNPEQRDKRRGSYYRPKGRTA
jgi:hypothetical protein